MNEDDVALARELAAGDEHAFQRLIEVETRRVFRACYRVLGRVDDAEDATQEAFLLAYKALPSYRGDGHPAAWLMRIATREAWRRSAAATRRGTLTASMDDELADRIPGDDPELDARLVSHDRVAEVRAAVGQLPEPYREVITLRYFGELSLKDVCALTGRPEGTVKAQVHRGLARLRDLMAEGER